MVTRYRPHFCRSRLSRCDNLRLNEAADDIMSFLVLGLLPLLVLKETGKKMVNCLGKSRSLKICCVFRLLDFPKGKSGIEGILGVVNTVLLILSG